MPAVSPRKGHNRTTVRFSTPFPILCREQGITGSVLLPTVFHTQRHGSTLVVTPKSGYHEICDAQLTLEVNRLLAGLNSDVTSVVIDLREMSAWSSDKLLGPIVAIWNRVRKQEGLLALCGVCEHGRQVLSRTRLDSLWQICPTRHEALALFN